MNKVFEIATKFLKHGEKISFFANLALTLVQGIQKFLEDNGVDPKVKK